MTDKPQPGEYAVFYDGYVRRVEGDILTAFVTQRDTMLAWCAGISEAASTTRAPGKWSLRQILGHVVDSERVFTYRALAVARGERQPLPGFDQDEYQAVAGFDSRSWASLVEEYDAVRRSTIAFYRNLPAEAWMRSGVVWNNPITVRALAWLTAGHELNHLEGFRTLTAQASGAQ